MTLYLGGKEIQILYVGRAHTRGDSIIFVPQDRIAYLSELYFADQFLFINDGYGVDWLRALDAVEALGADISCPDTDRFRPTRGRLGRGSAASGRCWWMCATPFRRRSPAARPKIRRWRRSWPQYEKLQGYDTQRETAVRRLYQQLTGKLP